MSFADDRIQVKSCDELLDTSVLVLIELYNTNTTLSVKGHVPHTNLS